MSQETHLPKTSPLSSWNVVRSKSVPTGASGTHAVATHRPVARTDTSLLNQEESFIGKVPPARIGIEPADFPVVKR